MTKEEYFAFKKTYCFALIEFSKAWNKLFLLICKELGIIKLANWIEKKLKR